MKALTTRAHALTGKEPALVIGVATTVVVAVLGYIATGQPLTVAAILPVIAAAIIRRYVASPDTLDAAKAEVPPGYVKAPDPALLQVGVEHHRDVRGRFVD